MATKASKNVVFRKIRDKVVLLAEGIVVMERKTSDPKGKSALLSRASKILYDWQRKNHKAVGDQRLILGAKNNQKLDLWFR